MNSKHTKEGRRRSFQRYADDPNAAKRRVWRVACRQVGKRPMQAILSVGAMFLGYTP